MFNDLNKMAYDTPKIYQWNLFWRKIEGCEPLNGINVYPRDDKSSAGFILKFGRFGARVRFSKRTRKWHWGFHV